MRHSEAEARAKQEVTRLSCKYIRDGVAFSGPIYMTGDAGGIKIGDAIIAFTGGQIYALVRRRQIQDQEACRHDR